jgi:hypothetical protein
MFKYVHVGLTHGSIFFFSFQFFEVRVDIEQFLEICPKPFPNISKMMIQFGHSKKVMNFFKNQKFQFFLVKN